MKLSVKNYFHYEIINDFFLGNQKVYNMKNIKITIQYYL